MTKSGELFYLRRQKNEEKRSFYDLNMSIMALTFLREMQLFSNFANYSSESFFFIYIM